MNGFYIPINLEEMYIKYTLSELLKTKTLDQCLQEDRKHLEWLNNQKPKRNQLREYRESLRDINGRINTLERLIKQQNCKHDQGKDFTFEDNKQINICKECRIKL